MRVDEFIGLRAKLCGFALRLAGERFPGQQRAKGVPKKAVPCHEAYRESMELLKEQKVDFFQLVSHRFQKGLDLVTKKPRTHRL